LEILWSCGIFFPSFGTLYQKNLATRTLLCSNAAYIESADGVVRVG
jgi:hypothetical protein